MLYNNFHHYCQQLIRPEEMTNPKVDDLSMMTNLSQFPGPGAPIHQSVAPRQNAAPPPAAPEVNVAQVRAYGPGIEPTGNQVDNPARFTVETVGAGKGKVDVLVLNPKGKTLPVSAIQLWCMFCKLFIC